MNKWQLQDKIIILDERVRQLVESNLLLSRHLENLWEEIGAKNEYIRNQKIELTEVKEERDEFHSKWSKCVLKKWEKIDEALEKKKKREAGRALIEKQLTDERTDN